MEQGRRGFAREGRGRPRWLRARVVVPVTMPPFENGVVEIVGGRIGRLGRWRDWRGEPGAVFDLGEVALFPGLVNAHCHLDYTDMAGQLLPPHSFTDWIRCITDLKRGWDDSDYQQSWGQGAAMLVRTGTTTVGDIEMRPELLPKLWAATPLRVRSFIELTGVLARRPPAGIVQEALEQIARLPRGRCRAWLSPHALYSTSPELLQRCGQVSRRRRWPLAVHVAESDEEYAMYREGRGSLHEWLAGGGRPMGDCGGRSPVQQLERLGVLGPRFLAIHVNHLAAGDAALLARRRVNVVHCPRSHLYFGHEPFPLRELQAAGVAVCLGTDSLATVRKRLHQQVELDMFAELRACAERFAFLSPGDLLRLATVNGARALGMMGRAGELVSGAWADCMAVPYVGAAARASDVLLTHTGSVTATLVGGQWARAPQEGAG